MCVHTTPVPAQRPIESTTDAPFGPYVPGYGPGLRRRVLGVRRIRGSPAPPGGRFIPNSVGNDGGWFLSLLRMQATRLLGGAAHGEFVTCRVDCDGLGALAALLESGGAHAVIDDAFPFERAPSAIGRAEPSTT